MHGERSRQVLFEGHALVDYGNFELAGAETWEDSGEAFRSGSVNALLAIGDPGHLFFMTGTYYGDVPVHVSLSDAEPPLADTWEDVVEASWESDGTEAILLSFDTAVPLGPIAAGTYRVRWCANGVEAADGARCPDPAVDSYAMHMWPASPTPPRVVRAGPGPGRAPAVQDQPWHFATLAGTQADRAEDWQRGEAR